MHTPPHALCVFIRGTFRFPVLWLRYRLHHTPIFCTFTVYTPRYLHIPSGFRLRVYHTTAAFYINARYGSVFALHMPRLYTPGLPHRAGFLTRLPLPPRSHWFPTVRTCGWLRLDTCSYASVSRCGSRLRLPSTFRAFNLLTRRVTPHTLRLV